MRRVTFKKENSEHVEFVTELTSFVLDQEHPFGVHYRSKCSSTLSEIEIEEFWSYVDQLLIENPVPGFDSVWKIEDNGNIYGYEN